MAGRRTEGRSLADALTHQDADVADRLRAAPVDLLLRVVESLTHRIHAARGQDSLAAARFREHRRTVKDEIVRRTQKET